ncbi:MAG: hypothetical protein K6T91_07265 [Firmicutes bacterium]|nr:hypothetical protein [Bacillota bacterium]
MLIKSQDKKTILSIADIAGFEISRDTVYPSGETRPTAGFTIRAIMSRYADRIALAEYASEDEALDALNSIGQWFEQGGKGTFEVK